ncbi:MAG: hydroxymethylbilane synthase [Sulfurospirillaceae bacterium]|nr:hydroxymethylbilane synthase [Sulfurospirillaceae bacterium]
MRKLIIATRGSKLALWQAEHIKDVLEELHNGLEVDLKIMKTKGDKILDTPLAKIGGKGLFTKELEESMLRGEAHIAVHSLKDVPVVFPDGLKLAVITKRADVRDAMLSEKYATLDDLPKGAIIGTTSLRRRMQLLETRPDLKIKNLRGNVNTRIRKLKDGEFDAIILASAGIKRLGLENEVKYFYPIDQSIMIPASGQAALGIEIVDDPEIEKLVSVLNDPTAIIETEIEREFVRKLEGGCQVPIGINAHLNGDIIDISCLIGMPDGTEILKEKIQISKDEYKGIGSVLAQKMIDSGARDILKKAEDMALNVIFEG